MSKAGYNISLMTIIFAGQRKADERLALLRQKLKTTAVPVKVVALSWIGDSGSELYSQKKQLAAESIGIDYHIERMPFDQPLPAIISLLKQLTLDQKITGVMIQKPRKSSYENFCTKTDCNQGMSFTAWWQNLISHLPEEKDIDGLAPIVGQKLLQGQKPRVLPATMRAVLLALQDFDLRNKKILILGKSDILGKPLTQYWKNLNYQVENWGRQESQGQDLQQFEVIISATGQAGLISGEQIKSGVILVDVGEPKGDLSWESCLPKARFITPVPGGIGPLTVACLLENAFYCSTKL